MPSRSSAIDFKQARAALAAADAHRHDAPLCLATAALLQEVAGQPRAGHSERVADGDRAAVYVVLVRIDAKLVTGIEALAGKSLVEFPDIDIVDFKTMALQQLRHGEDRTDAHLVRLPARRRPRDKAAERFKAAFFRVLGFHQNDGCRAIRQLAGVAGGNILAGALHRLELGEAFHGRVRPVALVLVDDVVDDAFRLGRLVDHLHLGLHRDDFVLELVGLLRGGHAALRFQRVLVLVFAADLVTLRDDIGGIDHRHEDVGRRLEQIRIDRSLGRAPAGDRDTLHAAGNDAVGAVRADAVGGHRDGLQSRRAETVHRYAGGRFRHPGEQRGLAADIGGAVRAIAEIAILDVVLLYTGALDGVLDGMGRHGHRWGDIEPAAAGFRQPGTGIRNNDGFTHFFDLPLNGPIMPREKR